MLAKGEEIRNRSFVIVKVGLLKKKERERKRVQVELVYGRSCGCTGEEGRKEEVRNQGKFVS